jgi:hypothetical protein
MATCKPDRKGTKDRKERTQELWAKFKAMSPAERCDFIQAHFCAVAVKPGSKMKPFTQVMLLEALNKSFQTSIKFEEAKALTKPEEDPELDYRNTFTGLDTVPRIPEDNTKTGTGRGRKRVLN